MNFKFHINLALKFYNLSCIVNNLAQSFLSLRRKVKNCHAKVVLIVSSYFCKWLALRYLTPIRRKESKG